MNTIYDFVISKIEKHNRMSKEEKTLRRIIWISILVFVCMIINVIGIVHAIWFPYSTFSKFFNVLWVLSNICISVYILSFLYDLLDKAYKLFRHIVKEAYRDKRYK